MDNGFSLSDIKAVMNDDGFNSSGSCWIIILFIILFGNGFWGNNGVATAASTQDLQRAVDLNAIQNGQAGINDNIQRTAYETMATVKDTCYNNLGEIRDVQAAASEGFAKTQEGFCATFRAIDGVKYEGAINTAAINANIDAKFAALEKSQLEDRIAEQSAQIQQLQLTNAMCGVPKINPYGYAVVPTNYNNNCGCGCGNYFNGTMF